MNNKNYIIYKGTGGLFHNLGGLSKAIEIAKKENRILINDMFSHIRENYKFHLKFEDFFIINDNTFEHYNNYDMLPKNIMFKKLNLEQIIRISPNKMKGNSYFYNEHDLTNIKKNNDRLIIFSGYNSYITSGIISNNSVYNQLKNEDKITEPYLSIHFRNTDMKHNIDKFISIAKTVINKTSIKTIYLASDDNLAYETFKKNIPDINIIRKTIPDNSKEGGIHYVAEDKNKQMYECLRDIYYILHSAIFIPSQKSAYSRSIINMIRNKKYIFPDIKSNTLIII